MAAKKKTTAAPKRPHVQRTVPLQRCYVAPENARFGVPEESVEELAANIEAYGLLQPLTGYEDDNGNFAICAGRRRLAALKSLQERALQPAAFAGATEWALAIPFTEIDQADAIGASLAENTERVDLGIVEAAVAFKRMTLDGKAEAEIARAFGVTERFVKGRLKLAGLHEPILEALRAGELSLDVAQIYAGAEMSRQERVWEKLGKSARRDDWRVKEELKKNTLVAGDSLAKFVGEDAYVAAGGIVEHELFKTADLSRWLDPSLAERLAKEKLKKLAGELEGEGFMFVEAAPEIAFGKYVDGNFGKARKPTAAEQTRLGEIKAREKAIDAESRAIEKAAKERTGEKWGDLTEEEEDREQALDDERQQLRTERDRIVAGQVEFDDKAKAKSGVTVTIDDDGRPLIVRGVVAPKEKPARRQDVSEIASKRASKVEKAQHRTAKAEPMTNTTHERLTRVASAIVGRGLMAKPEAAVTALCAFFARQVLKPAARSFNAHGNDHEIIDLRFADNRFARTERPALISDKTRAAQRDQWIVAFGKDWDDAETIVAAWPFAEQLKFLAFCTGELVLHVETFASADKKERVKLAALAKLTGVVPAAHYTPDADLLKGFSTETLQAAARDLGLDSAGVKTKGALAQLIADKAKDAAWTPPLVRTLCGVETKPAAKKAPAKKTAKAKPVKKAAPKPVKKVAKKAAKAVAK